MASAETAGVSVGLGIFLFGLTIFFGWLSSNSSINGTVLSWILLPTIAYGLAFGFNTMLQYSSCPKLNIGQIAIVSLFVPVAVLLFLGLSMIGLVRAPIEAAIPLQYKLQFASIVAVAYYMFWAAMFGESISAGFAQACPK